MIGAALAFVIESIDDRLRTSEEVEQASMLPAWRRFRICLTGRAWKGREQGGCELRGSWRSSG